MRPALMAAAIASATVGPLAAAGPSRTVDGTVRVVLKFVKRADGPGVRFDPASCRSCTVIADAGWNADNARETVVALTVPRSRTLEVGFDGATTNIRRVILEGGDVPFGREGERLVVALPPMETDTITAAEVATHIVEPGMVLRFEHGDPARRAGAYANGPFPDTQRAAADVLEFAQREVVRALGLGRYAESHGLGRIQIMGFDTNAPHDHRDAPPHVHMHLRWPANAGTQIGHYYIDAAGLLTHNIVGVKGIDSPERRFGRGETFNTIGPDGRPVYSHRITEQGWLEVGRPDGANCLIRPADASGFARGAWVTCSDGTTRRVTVEDDWRLGRLKVGVDRIEEMFSYDPDTGALRSPAQPPPAPPSVFAEPTTIENPSSTLLDQTFPTAKEGH